MGETAESGVDCDLVRCQLQLHRLGDLTYRLWCDQAKSNRNSQPNHRYVLLNCCSRARREVAWRTAELYNRTINTVSLSHLNSLKRQLTGRTTTSVLPTVTCGPSCSSPAPVSSPSPSPWSAPSLPATWPASAPSTHRTSASSTQPASTSPCS